MPRIYRHRINTVEALEKLPPDLGLEFDLRSDGDRVIVTHDPHTDGPTIEEFFPKIGARPCIFNVKCEGIEARVAGLAQSLGIEDYFFLDCSVPAAVKLWRAGNRRVAVRYSELEPVEGVLAWAGKATWCWVDCFERFPVEEPAWSRVADALRICLVSPELQGHGPEADARLRASLEGRTYHAVCTKKPESWGYAGAAP
ncbi:MAG: hypothetical protein JNL38_30785 [Myxococcales bacterium]|jgi:hypothetical protein|nr:hypothetical protein [Myxococcales bacterium]